MWAPSARAVSLTKSRKIPTRKILPHFFVTRKVGTSGRGVTWPLLVWTAGNSKATAAGATDDEIVQNTEIWYRMHTAWQER